MKQYNAALNLIKELNDKGFLAYIVGGYVRDKVLNIISNDIDITTNALPSELMEFFDIKKSTANQYLSCVLSYEGFEFELTTFRMDLEYHDHRHPITAVANNLEADLIRRDFTIDALVLDSEERIIDLFGGLDDIKNKQIKTIGNPYKRFDEDALRILRACYLASKLQFDIEKNTLNGMIENSKYLPLLSTERIFAELIKLLSYPGYKKGLTYLLKSNAAKYFGFTKAIDYILKSDIKPSLDDLIVLSIYMHEAFAFKLTKMQEKTYNEAVQLAKDFNLGNEILYKYDIKAIKLANKIRAFLKEKSFDEKEIDKLYDSLPIKDRKDIVLNSEQIIAITNKSQGPWLGQLISKIEMAIINGYLVNTKEEIIKFIKEEKYV